MGAQFRLFFAGRGASVDGGEDSQSEDAVATAPSGAEPVDAGRVEGAGVVAYFRDTTLPALWRCGREPVRSWRRR